MSLISERLVEMRDGSGHEREFKLTVHEKSGRWECVLFIRPPSGRGWEEYARTEAPMRIDAIQAIAHYVVTA